MPTPLSAKTYVHRKIRVDMLACVTKVAASYEASFELVSCNSHTKLATCVASYLFSIAKCNFHSCCFPIYENIHSLLPASYDCFSRLTLIRSFILFALRCSFLVFFPPLPTLLLWMDFCAKNCLLPHLSFTPLCGSITFSNCIKSCIVFSSYLWVCISLAYEISRYLYGISSSARFS